MKIKENAKALVPTDEMQVYATDFADCSYLMEQRCGLTIADETVLYFDWIVIVADQTGIHF